MANKSVIWEIAVFLNGAEFAQQGGSVIHRANEQLGENIGRQY